MKKIIIAVVLVVALGAYWWWSSRTDSATVAMGTETPVSTSASSSPSTSGATSTGQYKDGTYTGTTANSVYGDVQVAAVVSGGKLTDVQFITFPKTPDHSLQVSNTALPTLKTEAIAMQSAQVSIVSGATQTSEAFQQSLQSALTQAQS
jgi:uncharacterized protein with FMN-binding domain